MFVQTDPTLMTLLYKIFMGIFVAGGIALVTWPFRKLSAIHAELTAQRENHLTHIEAHGKEQVDLLGKMCASLEGVRLDLKEQTGFIQAMAILPKAAPTRRKR
jgi:hypothetical protein